MNQNPTSYPPLPTGILPEHFSTYLPISLPPNMLTHHISEIFYKTPPMPPLATIAIVSPGDMGSAIAKLLIAHNYRVVTNVSDRRCLSSPPPL